MAGYNYYVLAALPSVGEPGSVPPITAAELLGRVSDIPPLRAILEAIFLGHDLLLREAFLGGEIQELEGLVVLTRDQARDEAPLPACLAAGAESARRIPADDLWEGYFTYAASVARQNGCAFLSAWVGFEVALRNALAVARAKALDLDPLDYIVAPELGRGDGDVAVVVNEWAAAATPLAGLRALDSARWAWLKDHDGWFTFRDDEVAAYGAKVVLLERWQRVARAEADGAGGAG